MKDKKVKKDNGNIEALKDKGCHDGNCVVYRPSGMHTNGGCKCIYRSGEENFLARKLAHEYREEVIRLRKELASLKEEVDYRPDS